MGTNYELRMPGANKCEHCGRSDNQECLHIGKSSGGWVFSLHVYPERGINDLDDWKPLFEKGAIYDEYGRIITAEEMLDVICNRSWTGSSNPTAEFYATNRAVPGPFGLVRHALDGFCIRHGSGTWDCLDGVFS